MAKEFKEWDKRFSKEAIEICRNRWLFNGSTKFDREFCTIWVHKVSSWDKEYIRHCVYESYDAHEWQLFRVSMKGLSTSEKLYMLNNYYDAKVVANASNNSGEEWVTYKKNKCRVDNYIGALRRGGQLDEHFEVIR